MYTPIWKFIDVLVFDILDHKVAPLLGNRRCYGNHFAPHSLGVVLMLASKNEVHVTTRNGVMAHFTLIHYMPV